MSTLEKVAMNDLKQALRTVLVTQFRVSRDSLDDNTALFSGGFIDSLSVMDLVCFVEGEIGQAVPGVDIILENFDSIARIVAYAHTLTSAGKGA
jgi:acyl carrier protein